MRPYVWKAFGCWHVAVGGIYLAECGTWREALSEALSVTGRDVEVCP